MKAIDYVWILGCIACGILFASLCLRILNTMPASWLCDYGEEPDAALLSKNRFFKKPHGIALAVSLVLSFILCYVEYGAGVTFFCGCTTAIVLIMIAICDAKYSIIPDQFTLFLLLPALVAVGYDIFGGGKVFHSNIFTPFLGAVCGGAVMLLLNLLGKIIYKKEGIGFGDVKLYTALGFFVGPGQIIVVFLLTILLAGVHFTYLILRKKIDGDHYLPLGPYICVAFLLFLTFHSQINASMVWYFSLFVK